MKFFTVGLVTSTGTYLLVVNDIYAFLAFGALHLKDNIDFVLFEYFYDQHMNAHPSNPEKGLLTLFSKYNTGLMLFKGNLTDFSQWEARKINFLGNVINQPCN